jgi:hypothetical protein
MSSLFVDFRSAEADDFRYVFPFLDTPAQEAMERHCVDTESCFKILNCVIVKPCVVLFIQKPFGIGSRMYLFDHD